MEMHWSYCGVATYWLRNAVCLDALTGTRRSRDVMMSSSYKKSPSSVAISLSVQNTTAILDAPKTAMHPAPSGRSRRWIQVADAHIYTPAREGSNHGPCVVKRNPLSFLM